MQKNGDTYTTYIGLARGYSANGNFKQAVENAHQGLLHATNAAEKEIAEAIISTLKQGKAIN